MKKIVINHAEAIRQQKLFQGLDPALPKQLEGLVTFRYFQNRQLVLQQGSVGDARLLVVSGRLQVVSFSEDGREAGIHFLEVGDFYGEVAMMANVSRESVSRAMHPAVVIPQFLKW